MAMESSEQARWGELLVGALSATFLNQRLQRIVRQLPWAGPGKEAIAGSGVARFPSRGIASSGQLVVSHLVVNG